MPAGRQGSVRSRHSRRPFGVLRRPFGSLRPMFVPLRGLFGQFRAHSGALRRAFGALRWLNGDLRTIFGPLRAAFGDLRTLSSDLRAVSGASRLTHRHLSVNLADWRLIKRRNSARKLLWLCASQLRYLTSANIFPGFLNQEIQPTRVRVGFHLPVPRIGHILNVPLVECRELLGHQVADFFL